jgi:flagellar basal body P-ring formation protein FlgA
MHEDSRLPVSLKCAAVGLTAIASWLVAGRGALAAELQLRAQCKPSGTVITLGDLAEIGSTDARQAASLAATELFPAPSAAEPRVVRVREIQDLLLLRGASLADLRFSGASEVTVSALAPRPRTNRGGPVPAAAAQRIKRRVCEAVIKYISEQVPASQTWSVDFALSEAQSRLLADPLHPIRVAGGCSPWTGSQRFDITIEGAKAAEHLTIEANVHIVAPVVVALRALARGAVIREGDVELRQSATAEKAAGALHAVEDAINHELVRPVSAGGIVGSDCLRAPLAVHRGEVVTVFARSGAIRISTNARAREEGSVGELVAVESLLNRGTYYARVSGIREVEVYARPPRVESQQGENASASSVVSH